MRSGGIAIEVQRLSKTFGNQHVLNEIDLNVSKGEAVSIVGANGSGKTTLLRCVSSRLRPSSGVVLWFGQSPIGNPSMRIFVGVMAHEGRLYPHLTVKENLVFAARMCAVVDPVWRVGELLRASGLGAQADCSVNRISQGMRQRVAILRALVHEPPILLLDEPSAGLDNVGTDWLTELLKDRRDGGCAICFATHDERLTDRLASRVVRLHSGQLGETDRMACGTAA